MSGLSEIINWSDEFLEQFEFSTADEAYDILQEDFLSNGRNSLPNILGQRDERIFIAWLEERIKNSKGRS
jgi:hypothetical protein